MELGKILEVPARHALEPQKKHGEIEDIEAREHDRPGRFCCLFIEHPSCHLREPVVYPRKKTEGGAAEHGVMKMADNEVGPMKVQVQRKCADN